jgi:hypothetical protein
MDAIYRNWFPNLTGVMQKKTSEATAAYNCIAWAFKENARVWWPDPRAYWPLPLQNLSTLEEFEALFASEGWKETANSDVEAGFEKIAFYTLNGTPTHASRLLPDGLWTSKLGHNNNLSIDLSHALNDLDGPTYGTVFKIYRKAAI